MGYNVKGLRRYQNSLYFFEINQERLYRKSISRKNFLREKMNKA